MDKKGPNFFPFIETSKENHKIYRKKAIIKFTK